MIILKRCLRGLWILISPEERKRLEGKKLLAHIEEHREAMRRAHAGAIEDVDKYTLLLYENKPGS